MVGQKKSLGEILVDKGVLSEDQLRQARDLQKVAPGDIGRIIVDLGYANDKMVTAARAQELGMPYYDLSRNVPDPDAVRLVPEHLIRRYSVIPIKKDDNGRLVVAVGDPKSSMVALDDIRIVSRLKTLPVLATESDIADAITRAFSGEPNYNPAKPGQAGKAHAKGPTNGARGGSSVPALIKGENLTPARIDGSTGLPVNADGSGDELDGNANPSELANALQNDLIQLGGVDVDDDEESLRDMADDAPIIRIAHTIVQQAIKERATDIHIEPEKRGVRIRFRIDGVLNEIMQVPKHIQAPLISRFKIMADLNIAERRIPQDGRIPVRFDGKDFDLRVSTIPANFGEKIVMRILDKSSILVGLETLGFSPEVRDKINELVIQPIGLLLATGPTGSGKTTTLYSILNKISTIEKNVITIEDPIEYQLPGINQVATNKKAGLTFATALRSFLRQDPDIIMVGEIRDLETAQIAIEAALTGHLVLSTLHTNDAPSSIMRLADMGIEPYLLAATIIGALAQRLARKICSNCREPYQAPATSLRKFGFPVEDEDAMVTLYRGRGCEECRGKKFKGRLGLYELMPMNEEIAELIIRRAPVSDIRDAAKQAGMKELREDGLLKVLDGLTTPDEVMRVVFTAGM